MQTKSKIALLVLPILTYACFAQAAGANQPANNNAQLEQCPSQAIGSLSPASDFVAVPYTFGNRLDYRPVWTSESQRCADSGQKTTKRHNSPSTTHQC